MWFLIKFLLAGALAFVVLVGALNMPASALWLIALVGFVGGLLGKAAQKSTDTNTQA